MSDTKVIYYYIITDYFGTTMYLSHDRYIYLMKL